MVLSELKQFGIDSRFQTLRFKGLTSQEKKFEFQQHLDSYVNEVIRDEPVSILFHYWLDSDNRLYLQPNLEEKNLATKMFDPRERNGVYLEGFKKVEKLLIENPNQIVLWYSPIGKTSFDDNLKNPFSSIDYDYGQLYIYCRNKDKVDALALKTSKEAENLFFPNNENIPLEENITKTILNPLLFNFNIDNFLNWLEKFYPPDIPFYVDHQQRKYFLSEIIEEINDRFSGKKKLYSEISDRTISELNRYEMTAEIVKKAFQGAIYNHLKQNNLYSMKLAGSCGGSTIDLDDLPFGQENFLFQKFNPATTVFRLMTQGIISVMKEQDRYENYHCPKCGAEIKGEIKGSDSSTWVKKCRCGHDFSCGR
jgi:hypothetical protein